MLPSRQVVITVFPHLISKRILQGAVFLRSFEDYQLLEPVPKRNAEDSPSHPKHSREEPLHDNCQRRCSLASGSAAQLWDDQALNFFSGPVSLSLRFVALPAELTLRLSRDVEVVARWSRVSELLSLAHMTEG